MIRAILWKEWKNCRKRFIFLLIGLAVMGVLSTVSFRPMVDFFSVWIIAMAGGFAGPLFSEQKRAGALPFLFARPATKPFLFLIHYLSHLLIAVLLIAAFLLVQCFFMEFRAPEFSPFARLLDPQVLFAVLLALLVFAATVFVATSSIVFSATAVGIVFVIFLASIFVFLKVFWKSIESFLSRMPSLWPGESPMILVWMLTSFSAVFVALTLWEVAFDEMRDAKNRIWIVSTTLASVCAVLLLIGMVSSIVQAISEPTGMRFKEIIVTKGKDDPPLVAVMSDGPGEDRLFAVGRFDYSIKSKTVGLSSLLDMKRGGRSFSCLPNKTNSRIAYISDKPFWGQEVRYITLTGFSAETAVSMRSYSNRIVSRLYVSPDQDRIAYLAETDPRFGKKSRFRLWITKISNWSVTDYIELPGSADEDATSAEWTPIGWTPDGYDFMLRRTGPEGPEIWSVDWVASEVQPFLEEFADAVITADDLPHDGGWISLVREEADRTWSLWLVNYRSGEKKELGVFDKAPTRAWAESGRAFNYWDAATGLYICGITDRIRQYTARSDIPPIRQMKLSPGGNLLACGIMEPDYDGGKPGLAVINLGVQGRPFVRLVEDFSSGGNLWDWLDDRVIVYAVGDELWQVDMDGEKTCIVSSGSYR